jgi:hypothetical protein
MRRVRRARSGDASTWALCVVLVLACGIGIGACERPAMAHISQRNTPKAADDQSSDWARRVGQPVLPKQRLSAREMKVEPATLPDTAYASRELVSIKRLVFRVSLFLPSLQHGQRLLIAPPAGELHVDVSDQRLRARFIGPGWPVDEGSEIRLRADAPGVYLFDGDGGRPLPPGRLASWFQGDEALRARAELFVRHEFQAPPIDGPGELLCALLAEWTQAPRDEVLRGCGSSMPQGFHFGLLIADLTAIVPMNIPRAQLRADAVDPPEPVATTDARALLDPRDMSRIQPTPVRMPSESAPSALVSEAVGGASLRVENHTPARVVVIVQGIAIGWIKPEAKGDFFGLVPGYYRVSALRTSSLQVQTGTLLHLPTTLQLGHDQSVIAPSAQPVIAPSAQLNEPLVTPGSTPEAAR